MVKQVQLSASLGNIKDVVKLAETHGLGVEIMAFAYPNVLDGDWRGMLQQYKELVKSVSGQLTLHGPFLDMVSGSPDPQINGVCRRRYQHSIRIAAELGAKYIVFHANFIGSLHNRFYRDGWHKRNVAFWQAMTEYAQEYGVTVVLENMWEFDPTIISDLLEAVNHSHLRACLDVGHAHVFTDQQFTFEDWLQALAPHIVHLHANNNNGIIDEHHGFDWEHGVLDYHKLLPLLDALPESPSLVLEMDQVQDMRDSLYYFNINVPATGD